MDNSEETNVPSCEIEIESSQYKLYCMTNPIMPGICKVGCTAKHVEHRAKQLSSTSVPTSFNVEFFIRVEDSMIKYERLLHSVIEFEGFERINSKREFFRCQPNDIKKYFNIDILNLHEKYEKRLAGKGYRKKERSVGKLDISQKTEPSLLFPKIHMETSTDIEKYWKKYFIIDTTDPSCKINNTDLRKIFIEIRRERSIKFTDKEFKLTLINNGAENFNAGSVRGLKYIRIRDDDPESE